MSREVVFLRWCSACESDGVERVEAVESYTIGLVKGETRPALRVLDLCAEHAEKYRLLAVAVGKHSIPFDPKAKSSPPPSSEVVAIVTGKAPIPCRICDRPFARTNLAAHIWTHSTVPRPEQPAKCPECGERAPRMGVHRAQAHGWSAVDDAYEGITL